MTFLYGSPLQEGTRDWGLLAKYTVRPMDPMGYKYCFLVIQFFPNSFPRFPASVVANFHHRPPVVPGDGLQRSNGWIGGVGKGSFP